MCREPKFVAVPSVGPGYLEGHFTGLGSFLLLFFCDPFYWGGAATKIVSLFATIPRVVEGQEREVSLVLSCCALRDSHCFRWVRSRKTGRGLRSRGASRRTGEGSLGSQSACLIS